MKLIVGLGNPGRGYSSNRHNIGFLCLNHFARTHGIAFDRKQALARIGMGEIAGHKIILARPQTYMNLSGQSVGRLVKRYSVKLDDLIVIHDDLDLPLGKMRIRQSGRSAGHRGIESIISELGSQDFIRLRIGIGRPTLPGASDAEVINFVLGDFSPEEKRLIGQLLPEVSEALLSLITEGLEAAMNKYN